MERRWETSYGFVIQMEWPFGGEGYIQVYIIMSKFIVFV